MSAVIDYEFLAEQDGNGIMEIIQPEEIERLVRWSGELLESIDPDDLENIGQSARIILESWHNAHLPEEKKRAMETTDLRRSMTAIALVKICDLWPKLKSISKKHRAFFEHVMRANGLEENEIHPIFKTALKCAKKTESEMQDHPFNLVSSQVGSTAQTFTLSSDNCMRASYENKFDEKVYPLHYRQTSIEPIQVIKEYKLNFNMGQVIKYVLRAPYKGDHLSDLKKALYYLQDEIREMEKTERN